MKILVIINVMLFAIGIFAPCLKVTPHLGEGGSYDFIGKIFYGTGFDPVKMSIFDSIQTLIEGGDYLIGTIIILFTVLFPLFKMFLLFDHYFAGVSGGKRLKLTVAVSKYSMLDVFVIGLILLSIKTLPGGSTAEIQLGSLFFCLNVILSKILLSVAVYSAAKDTGKDKRLLAKA